MMLPSPASLLGMPDSKFSLWFPGQDKTFSGIMDWFHSDSRFLGLPAPAGSGKTILALLTAKLSDSRTVALTVSKGLQSQYLGDGGSIGMVDVRGQQNFPCPLVSGLRADEGPCHDGSPCPLKAQSCPYQQQLNRAISSQLIVTNYAYYLAQSTYSQRGLGDIGLLICDEADQSFNALESHLTINLSRLDIEPVGIQFPPYPLLPLEFPKKEKHAPDEIRIQSLAVWECWRSWAEDSLPQVQAEVSRLESEVKSLRQSNHMVPFHLSRALRSAKSASGKLERLSRIPSTWWVIQRTQHGFRFVPKWVAPYSSALFQSMPKIILMSATLSHKTMDLLGVPPAPVRSWLEVGSYFPPRNTPIYHVPTARINFRVDDFATTLWASRIDQYIDRRLDRKGIIFTVSYERARYLIQMSRHSKIMMTHSTSDVVWAVEKFKKAPAPCILVSPTVVSGWDFPEDTGTRYICVGKVPYPDSRDTVTKARQDDDKDWGSYLAVGTFVQEACRATRSSTARTEVAVFDDQFCWFWPAYGPKFAPKWFQARVIRGMERVPDPLV